MIKSLLFLFACSIVFSQISFFPDDRAFIYPKMKMMEAKDETDHLLSDIYPFSKNTMKSVINGVNYLDESNWRYDKEFNFVPKSILMNENESFDHFINWKEADVKFHTELKIYGESIFEKKVALSGAGEYRLIGSFNDKIHFMFLNREISLLTNKRIALENSYFLNNSHFEQRYLLDENLDSSDYNEGFIAYNFSEDNYFYFGKIAWEVGFGESGKLILNKNQIKPISGFGINFNFWRIQYHTLHGSLLASELLATVPEQSNPDKNFQFLPDKYIVNHRFEITATENLKFHYNETIIYGNRSIDLSYAHPFSFLRSQEHEQVDRDNALISLGFKYRIPKYNVVTYHDFLLDEWRLEEISSYFTDDEHWFGNKQSMLNGITWSYDDLQIWFEHVSIAPYVYSHKFSVNRYTHDGSPIGYLSGPNSKTYFTKIAYFLTPEILLESSFRYQENGYNFNPDNTDEWNVGGDIFHGDDTRFKDTRTFLEGQFNIYKSFQLNLSYIPSYYYQFNVRFNHNTAQKSRLNFLTIVNL